MRRYGYLVLMMLGVTSQAEALTLKIADLSGDTVPEISYVNGSGLPLGLVLQLANTSSSDSLPVSGWQSGLRLQPDPAAQGSLLFESMAIPDGSLYGSYSAPGPPITAAASEIVVSDADLTGANPAVPAGLARNVLQLGLSVSPTAQGTFVLTMSGYDLSDIDHASFWFPVGEVLPTPFDNVAGSGEPQQIVLARIRVIDVPEPSSILVLLVGAALLARWPRVRWRAGAEAVNTAEV